MNRRRRRFHHWGVYFADTSGLRGALIDAGQLTLCLEVLLGKRGVRDVERALLAASAGHRPEAIFVLALASGIREGELMGLTWANVDAEAGMVRVAPEHPASQRWRLALQGAEDETEPGANRGVRGGARGTARAAGAAGAGTLARRSGDDGA